MAWTARINDAQVALLGLLCEEPMHAWEIERTVEHRDMRSWTDLSQSTIYKHLAALKKAGCVDSSEEVVNGRLRRTFSITDDGRESLRESLCSILSGLQHQKWQIDLATYNFDLIPAGDAAACLESYRRDLVDAVRRYRELEKYLADCGCPRHRHAVARRAIHLLEGDLRWVEEFIAESGQS